MYPIRGCEFAEEVVCNCDRREVRATLFLVTSSTVPLSRVLLHPAQPSRYFIQFGGGSYYNSYVRKQPAFWVYASRFNKL